MTTCTIRTFGTPWGAAPPGTPGRADAGRDRPAGTARPAASAGPRPRLGGGPPAPRTRGGRCTRRARPQTADGLRHEMPGEHAERPGDHEQPLRVVGAEGGGRRGPGLGHPLRDFGRPADQGGCTPSACCAMGTRCSGAGRTDRRARADPAGHPDRGVSVGGAGPGGSPSRGAGTEAGARTPGPGFSPCVEAAPKDDAEGADRPPRGHGRIRACRPPSGCSGGGWR